MAAGIFEAYVSGSASALYGGHFGRVEDRLRAVRTAQRALPPDVAEVLEAQARRFGGSEARTRQLERLRQGAAAVVTGQQVGLFLGPLYTVYKAASAVRLARALEDETRVPVVPIFWLQSEDHDLVEIASCNVLGSHVRPLSLAVPVPRDNRISVAHCVLPGEVDACMRELSLALGHHVEARVHLARLERHYRAGAPWVDAFAGVMSELFADTGLVFIDPRDPALAGHAARVHRRALSEAGPLSRALLARVAELEGHGWAAPLHVREGAPLSFFHPEGPTGPRFRLAEGEPLVPPTGEHGGPTRERPPRAAPRAEGSHGFSEVGGEGRHTLESLNAVLDRSPLSFSTSALLRPILQDTLLPTAAYVGGPAEVAYFAQLSPLYAAYGLAMPLVVPRSRFRVVEDRAQALLDSLGVPLEAFASHTPASLAASRAAEDARTPSPDALSASLEGALSRAANDVLAPLPLDALGLTRARASLGAQLSRTVARFRRRYERRLLATDGETREALERLESLLLPGGAPQERVYALATFAARHGEDDFLSRVLEAATPYEYAQKDLRP